jgi:hypothetical protein
VSEGPVLDRNAVARGALAGLVLIVPVTIARALASHGTSDFDHSGWAVLFFFFILGAYGVSGWVAGAAAPDAPLTNGALAALGAILLWLPLRVVVWLIRRDHHGLFTGAQPAITLGELFGAFVLGAAVGIVGALVAARQHAKRAGRM